MLAGTELRKQRRLSEVLTDTFNILFAHWRPLAIVSVPVVVANVAFSLVILAIAQDFPTTEEIANDTAEFESGDLVLLIAIGLLYIPIVFALQQLVTGGCVAYLDSTDQGKSISPPEALDQAQNRLGPLVGATLRATLIIIGIVTLAIVVGIGLMAALGLLGLIIGLPIMVGGICAAINRGVKWVFLAQVIMVEDRRGQAVLAGSAGLVSGRWWNTFGRLIVVGLVVQIPIGVLQQALIEAAPGVVGTILVAMTGFIQVPFGIIGLSLMYFDLHARKAENDLAGTPQEPAP